MEIDLETRRVNGTVSLTEREADALRYLAERAGEVVGREQLEREVWGFRPGVRSEAVPVTLRRLRAKIERDPDHPTLLLTVHGRGWRLLRPPLARRGPPGFATPFLPRAELAGVAERLVSYRLVTLLGPGGAGKTRLAAEIARTAPGSVFVDLKGCTREDAVAAAVGHAIGASSSRLSDLALMLGREDLVVLDNAEDAACAVARLAADTVRQSSEVRLLVATRQALDVQGETVCELGGLDDALAEQLLGERVAAAGGSPPSAQDARSLARAVGGSPLALELCAGVLARGLAPTEAVLAHLHEVPGDSRVAATFAWSWQRLPADHQQLLVDCTLFRSPFDAEAAAQVLGPGAEPGLRALRRAWLIDRRSDRWHLLPLVRAMLVSRRPSSAAQGAHRAWLAQQMELLMEGWLRAPAAACDRAAELRDELESASSGDDPVLAAQAALCVARWSELDGPDPRPWLAQVRGPLPPRLAAEVSLARSVAAVNAGDAELWAQAERELADPLPWPELELHRRVHFVVRARREGDYEGALRWFPLVPDGAEVSADARCLACHWTSGTVRHVDPVAADRALAEGYAISVQEDLPGWQAVFLNSSTLQRDGERRRRTLERAVELAIACRRRTTAVVGLLNLRISYLIDDPARAATYSLRALELAATVPARTAAAFALGVDRYLADDPEGGLTTVHPWIEHVGRLESGQAEEYRLYHAALLAACGDTVQSRARFDALDRHLLRMRFHASDEELDLLLLLLRREIDLAEGRRGDASAAERARAAAEAARTWAAHRTLRIRVLAAVIARRCA